MKIAFSVVVYLLFVMIRRLIIIKLELKNICKQLEEDDDKRVSNLKLRYLNSDIEKFAEVYNNRAKHINSVISENEKSRKQFKRMLREMMHDFKTPITVIMGYAELMGDGDLGEEDKEYLSAIKRRVEQLDKSVVKMNDYFSIGKNIQIDNLEKIDLNAALLNSLSDLYEYVDELGIKAKVTFSKSPLIIMADSDIIGRVLENLLINATKYTTNCAFQAETKLSDDKSKGCIEIMNESEFLSEMDLSMIFELFYRKDMSRHDGSSGVGLSIVKSYMEKVGGNVTANYSDGKFIIRLEFNLYVA